jgi:dsRNA-specific ribonuclease
MVFFVCVGSQKHEFHGDAALYLSTTTWLLKNYPNDEIGVLTSRRQCIISNDFGLTKLADHLELTKFVQTRDNMGGKKIPNVVEALIGYVFFIFYCCLYFLQTLRLIHFKIISA